MGPETVRGFRHDRRRPEGRRRREGLKTKVRFDKSLLRFEAYPFPPACVFPDKSLQASALVEANPGASPPQVRTRQGEVIFLPTAQRAELEEFASTYGIPAVRRVDVWGLIAAPFVESDVDEEETLARLDENGVTREESRALRSRVSDILDEFAAKTGEREWVRLGLFEILEILLSLRPVEDEFSEFYFLAMQLSNRGRAVGLPEKPKPTLSSDEPAKETSEYWIQRAPAGALLAFFDDSMERIGGVSRPPMAARVFVSSLAGLVLVGAGLAASGFLPVDDSVRAAILAVSIAAGAAALVALQPRASYDVSFQGETISHRLTIRQRRWRRWQSDLLTPDERPIAVFGRSTLRAAETGIVFETRRSADGRELVESSTGRVAARLKADRTREGYYRLEGCQVDDRLIFAWSILELVG